MNADQRFETLGLQLPPPPQPIGVYKPFLQLGNQVLVSGHGTFQPDGSLLIGRVGKDLDLEEAKKAAELVGLAILSTLQTNLGSLDRIERVVKVLGMVIAFPLLKSTPT